MVVVGPDVAAPPLRWEPAPALEAIADAAGDSPVFYSLHVYGADRVAERRRNCWTATIWRPR
jgi:hypothetical protein